jgi:hypothetical protein
MADEGAINGFREQIERIGAASIRSIRFRNPLTARFTILQRIMHTPHLIE